MFPIFWDNENNEGHGGFCVFPLYWAEWKKNDFLQHKLWPIYSYKSRELSEWSGDSSEFSALCHLVGFKRETVATSRAVFSAASRGATRTQTATTRRRGYCRSMHTTRPMTSS